MSSSLTRRLAMLATFCVGVLTGVTANRALVELPAWERVGVIPWANFMRAENHGIGAAFYPVIGAAALIFTVATAIAFRFDRAARGLWSFPVYSAGALAIVWAAITRAFIVPAMFHVQAAGNDADELQRIFQTFVRWSAVNDFLHVLTFGLSLWALVEIFSASKET